MDATMTLVDGRSLGWATFGDPDGRPLVALHGSPDSRMIWRITDGAASRLGIRVIAPDRPGFGLSDPKPQRTVLDWVADQRALAHHLGLRRYPIIAVSGGSLYATAFAWAEAATVTHLGLFSVIAPLHAPGVLDGTNRVVGTTFRIARRAPAPLGLFIARMMVRTVRRDPEAAMRRLLRTRPPADREVIERPEIGEILRENLPNQFNDAGSIAHELRLAAHDWGFPLGEIRPDRRTTGTERHGQAGRVDSKPRSGGDGDAAVAQLCQWTRCPKRLGPITRRNGGRQTSRVTACSPARIFRPTSLWPACGAASSTTPRSANCSPTPRRTAVTSTRS